MPDPSDVPGGRGGPGNRRGAVRVVVDPEGPLLLEGPVEIELPDGSTACSDRFMVAVCTCRRSRRYPWCDTSHRRRTRPGAAPGDRTA
ncbi:CDGSH iron-sulfur domain-containing protein [Streptomyces sp. NPDC047097]|uniref:CDGSH iron-sulfur domain-containing protein n=1 Tax=Streptomyces sp. NPDC047097 TaxID=3155260 RepID=UPI0033E4E052